MNIVIRICIVFLIACILDIMRAKYISSSTVTVPETNESSESTIDEINDKITFFKYKDEDYIEKTIKVEMIDKSFVYLFWVNRFYDLVYAGITIWIVYVFFYKERKPLSLNIHIADLNNLKDLFHIPENEKTRHVKVKFSHLAPEMIAIPQSTEAME